jgi:hypothetical protein
MPWEPIGIEGAGCLVVHVLIFRSNRSGSGAWVDQ